MGGKERERERYTREGKTEKDEERLKAGDSVLNRKRGSGRDERGQETKMKRHKLFDKEKNVREGKKSIEKREKRKEKGEKRKEKREERNLRKKK